MCDSAFRELITSRARVCLYVFKAIRGGSVYSSGLLMFARFHSRHYHRLKWCCSFSYVKVIYDNLVVNETGLFLLFVIYTIGVFKVEIMSTSDS